MRSNGILAPPTIGLDCFRTEIFTYSSSGLPSSGRGSFLLLVVEVKDFNYIPRAFETIVKDTR